MALCLGSLSHSFEQIFKFYLLVCEKSKVVFYLAQWNGVKNPAGGLYLSFLKKLLLYISPLPTKDGN